VEIKLVLTHFKINSIVFSINHDGYNLKLCGLNQGLGLGTHLFVKVPQPGDSEGTGTFLVTESSCHLLLPSYQSNHSKVEAIPPSASPKDTTSKLAGLSPN